MEIKFEFETKIKTNDGEEKKVERKVSFSELKKKAKAKAVTVVEKAIPAMEKLSNFAEDAADVVIDAVMRASEVPYDVMAKAEKFINRKNDEENEESDEDEDGDDTEEEPSFSSDNAVGENKASVFSKEAIEDKMYTLTQYLDLTSNFEEKFACSEESVIAFFKAIDFPASEYSKKAFEMADWKLYSSTNTFLIAELVKQYFPEDTIDSIIDNFKTDFKNWLEKRPDVKQHCYRLNFRMLFLYFLKKTKDS
ncbi:MAG: hypothetical protein ACI35S_08595 [Anaeroplasma sp.]